VRTIRFNAGRSVPVLGQGTWHMGERGQRRAEADALRLGLDLGMTLIDTAEMYADGGAEEVVGEAIKGRRDSAFIVTKVYPHNAARASLPAACARSLRRLRIDCIDLYLLHWRGNIPLAETVDAFEALRAAGKILAWGVSNLDERELDELASLSGGQSCATDQVLYNPEARGIEFSLLPWCAARSMPVMAYTPLGQGGRLLRAPALKQVADRHGATPAQVALAWALRHPHVLAIPKAANAAHVRENAAAAMLALDAADFAAIDAAFPPPRRRIGLQML
jgi:diketogulonate reductase-like aldo/keto reductase